MLERYSKDKVRIHFDRRHVLVIVFLFLLGLPLVLPQLTPLSSLYLGYMTKVFIFAIFALSYNLLFGFTGLVSFGHALFFGLGAYVIGMASLHLDLSYLQAIPLALVVVAVIAALVGAASLRLSGVYFAMITLAFGQMFYQLVLKFPDLTKGVNGIYEINIPVVLGVDFSNTMAAYFLVLAVLGLTYLSLYRLSNSPFGRVIQGIRENEERIQMLGVNTYRVKVVSFVIAGLFASVAGLLYPVYINFVGPNLLHWSTTGDVLLITLIGGIGSLWGPVFGAFFFIGSERFLIETIEHWRIPLGMVFVIFILLLPSGFAGLVSRFSD
jgi:branched-chain amino acid transport system permease protein